MNVRSFHEIKALNSVKMSNRTFVKITLSSSHPTLTHGVSRGGGHQSGLPVVAAVPPAAAKVTFLPVIQSAAR